MGFGLWPLRSALHVGLSQIEIQKTKDQNPKAKDPTLIEGLATREPFLFPAIPNRRFAARSAQLNLTKSRPSKNVEVEVFEETWCLFEVLICIDPGKLSSQVTGTVVAK
jgi:hypothetical protein